MHVYGNLIPVGYSDKDSVQHKGIGKKLIKKAEQIAFLNNKEGVAIISGVGVEKYYEKLGYENGNYYMIKEFRLQLVEYVKFFITFVFMIYIGYLYQINIYDY